jgi:hypothetical protein
MAFDINNQYTGNLFGRDRIGHTTPDAEATECLRPWLPVPYPAPYLPTARQDQGHPVLANVVLSSQQLVGQDSSGAFVPAGLFCGSQEFDSGHATNAAGLYCAFKYSQGDVGFAYNAITGNLVAAAGEVAVLAAPSNGVSGDVITFADGTTYTVTTTDVTNALACNLFGSEYEFGLSVPTTLTPVNRVRPIGLTIRNVFQYLGGVDFNSTVAGQLSYKLNGVIPVKFKVHNYMHEMGTAIQTAMVIRLPWIGSAQNTLSTDASTDGVLGYVQTNYGRSFVHFTGAPQFGQLVMGSIAGGGTTGVAGGDAGHYASWDGGDVADICGRIVGIQNMYPIRDYANRVRTLWDPSRLVGPIKDPNPSSIMMGGSSTGGIDYQLNLGTDGIFKSAYDQGKTLRNEYSTYVLVKVGGFL